MRAHTSASRAAHRPPPPRPHAPAPRSSARAPAPRAPAARAASIRAAQTWRARPLQGGTGRAGRMRAHSAGRRAGKSCPGTRHTPQARTHRWHARHSCPRYHPKTAAPRPALCPGPSQLWGPAGCQGRWRRQGGMGRGGTGAGGGEGGGSHCSRCSSATCARSAAALLAHFVLSGHIVKRQQVMIGQHRHPVAHLQWVARWSWCGRQWGGWGGCRRACKAWMQGRVRCAQPPAAPPLTASKSLSTTAVMPKRCSTSAAGRGRRGVNE